MLRLDHVLFGVRDLDASAARFEREYGLTSARGGTHPGWGTGNRIVPLGDGYLELIGVVDEAQAADAVFGRWLASQVQSGDRFVAWCLAAADLESVAGELGLNVLPGERALPDGTRIGWRLAGLDLAWAEPGLPFFISWDEGSPHPSRMSAAHVRPGWRIAWVEVAGDEPRVRRWSGDVDVDVRVAAGSPGLNAIGLSTPDGEVEIRP